MGGIALEVYKEKIKKTTFRLTIDDYEVFKEKVKDSGLSAQKYIYYSVFSKKIIHKDYTEINKFTNKLSEIEFLLNEFAKYINKNDKETIKAFLYAKKELNDLWQLLREKL